MLSAICCQFPIVYRSQKRNVLGGLKGPAHISRGVEVAYKSALPLAEGSSRLSGWGNRGELLILRCTTLAQIFLAVVSRAEKYGAAGRFEWDVRKVNQNSMFSKLLRLSKLLGALAVRGRILFEDLLRGSFPTTGD